MTRVEFYDEGGRITGFRCQGHSGYDTAGRDIVCAAVTTAVRMAECVINDVCGSRARTKTGTDSVSLHLPARCAGEETVQAVLAGMMLTLSALRDEYPDYLEVMEVQQNA